MIEAKEYNDKVIKDKYYFIIKDNHKCTKAEKEENLREYKTKINLEKGILRQFG